MSPHSEVADHLRDPRALRQLRQFLGCPRQHSWLGDWNHHPAPAVALSHTEGEKPMDEDRTKGKAKDVLGTAKETVGKATGDKDTERSGKADQVEGKAQKGAGKAKDALRGKK
jgi:uncharacterized protein YjbJ (UPF0337 family)